MVSGVDGGYAAREDVAAAAERPWLQPLTIFSYVWAGQTLCQLAFFTRWFENGDWSGYLLLSLALLVLVYPSNLRLFLAMLVGGIVHYVGDWPFVSNHILIDTVLSATMIAAMLGVLGSRLVGFQPITSADRTEIWSLLAPVCGAIFVFLYYAILISKLNKGFFDLEISCMSTMYSYFLDKWPMLGTLLGGFSMEPKFWAFMLIEALIPAFLTFRRTRLLALYIGVPFHIALGLMGHWSFASMMIALYVLIAMPAVVDLLTRISNRIPALAGQGSASAYALFVVFNVLLVASAVFVRASVPWLLWTLVLAAVLGLAALRAHLAGGLFENGLATRLWTPRPGLLWLFFGLAVLNSASPYIGFKTQTSVAMYSNMRTEGGVNNHFFMPVVPLFGFQTDLVEIVDSNNDAIRELKSQPSQFEMEGVRHDVYVTYFEFRRAVSSLPDRDLEIVYRRNGELRTFRRGAPDNVDADLEQPLPRILAKIAYFRPVFRDKAHCLH